MNYANRMKLVFNGSLFTVILLILYKFLLLIPVGELKETAITQLQLLNRVAPVCLVVSFVLSSLLLVFSDTEADKRHANRKLSSVLAIGFVFYLLAPIFDFIHHAFLK